MADLSQTTTSVTCNAVTNSQVTGLAGGAITVGMPVYSDGTYYYAAKASGNAMVAGNSGVGIALNSAPAAGQPVQVFTAGDINLGATLAVGLVYVISTNSGKIAPNADMVTNDYVTILGTAVNASFIRTPRGGPFASNTQKA